jgi:hypothetical protein
MRYLARWINGVWVTYDSMTMKHVALHGREVEALDNAKRANGAPAQPRR